MKTTRTFRLGAVAADLFAGAMGVAGAVGLLGGGIQFPLDWLRGTPFSDYTVPGLILGVTVGGSGLAAGLLTALAQREVVGAVATAVAGGVLVGWIVGEYALLGYVSWMQPAFFAFGLLQLGLAAALDLTARSHRLTPQRPQAGTTPSGIRHAA